MVDTLALITEVIMYLKQTHRARLSAPICSDASYDAISNWIRPIKEHIYVQWEREYYTGFSNV